MSVLFIALPIALLLGLAALIACVFCLRNGQYDDLESPPVRILIEDTATKLSNKKEQIDE